MRDPMIVSWPGGLGDAGGLRSQYCHAVDVMPTILDLLGIEPPEELGGVAQLSLDGTSIRAVMDDAAAPDPRTEQYYEVWGSRAMYHDGWKAVTDHVNQLTRAEVDHLEGSSTFAEDTWKLFDTRNDQAEITDLAEQHPDKLADLVERWYREAERNQVLPLDDSRDNRIAHLRLPFFDVPLTRTYRPGDKVHEAHGPILGGSFRLAAVFDDGDGEGLTGTESGVLGEQGDWITGWAWYLRDGLATWVYVRNGHEHRVEGRVSAGTRALEVVAADRAGGGYDLTLSADGTELDRTTFAAPLPLAIAPDGAFLTVGYGRPFPVTDDYEPPFPAPPSLVALRYDLGVPAPVDPAAIVDEVLRHQ